MMSGVRPFQVPTKAKYLAYCDMTTDNGGWTLVGQSADNTNDGEFGWHTKRGDVNVTDKAYCLNALEVGIAIDEVLIAWGTRNDLRSAYRIKPPIDFPSAFENSSTTVQSLTKVTNTDCSIGQGTTPFMFGHMGRHNRTDAFFFRDNDSDGNYGLKRDGWNTHYDTCIDDGRFRDRQGLVFVRQNQ